MTGSVNAIQFYRANDTYGAFSNFAPYPVQLKGKRWPTSEHYFQAQKFADTDHEEQVRQAANPYMAFRLARVLQRFRRPDWFSMRGAVMLEAVRAKFSQHADLQALLLGTGNAPLVEHTARDDYWGDGGDGHGKNRLARF